MRLIPDTAVTRELGEEIVSVLEGAVLPGGDCAACGRQLGDGAFRLSVYPQPTGGVLVTAVHATCGTSNLQHGGLLVVPPGTWTAAGAVITTVKATPSRTWWGGRREQLEETPIPLVIVSPSCDVFYLGRRDGRLITPVEHLLLEGYDRAGEIRFHAAAREDLTVSLDTDELTISPLFLDEYSIDVREGFADMLDVAGGLLLAITHEPIGALAAGEGDAAELERVTTSPHSAFAWIPAESIQKS